MAASSSSSAPMIPRVPTRRFRLNLERLSYWVSVGAQPTDRARKVINTVKRAAEAAPAEAATAEAPAGAGA